MARRATGYTHTTAKRKSVKKLEEVANVSSGPKLFQLYIHKDKSITDDLIERCSRANFDGMCITVDTLVAVNIIVEN